MSLIGMFEIDFDAYEPGYCCRCECCGPGSWCCARARKHTHDEDDE